MVLLTLKLLKAKIIVDEKGTQLIFNYGIEDFLQRMIESFMLAANETVAEHYFKERVPFLYRIHETPDSDRIIVDFLAVFGIDVHGDIKNVKTRDASKSIKICGLLKSKWSK